MAATIIDGVKTAKEIRGEVAAGVADLKREHGVTPGLTVILVGEDPASAVYVRNKQRAAAEAGMTASDIKLPENATQADLLAQVAKVNNDPAIHGLLVQLPLPGHISENNVIESISPMKDVDGLHPFSMGRLMAGRPRFIPATPSGVQQLLMRWGHDPEGAHVVVCGRSNIVGKPVAMLLAQRQRGANATVTVCHTRTKDIAAVTRQADILVAAVGVPEFVTGDMVSDGVVVIDVGINRVDDASRRRGYRLAGDVHFESVAAKAGAITPVPGGVGPMTIAMLLSNTLHAARLSVDPSLDA